MAKRKRKNDNNASLGFEAKLWEAADLLRSNMDPAEYKHVVLGLLFLKYISDAFEERREWLRNAVGEPESEYLRARRPANCPLFVRARNRTGKIRELP
jgi:type I restriction enzyme M protein